MTAARNVLAILAGLAVGYGVPALFLIGPTDFGVAAAIAAACWLGIELLHYIERHTA